MKNYEAWDIAGHDLEYLDNEHQYLVDGVCVPSVTQILKTKFGNKYDGVSKATLNNASRLGTAVHEAIQRLCEQGQEVELPEIRNFKFLQKQYGFEVLDNELPVILFKDDEPICAGRLDMVIEINGQIGLGDIKRTSTLDKEYLAYQLNIYRIAYQQCYEQEIQFLKGLHLRGDVRKFVDIPINEDKAWELIEEYLKGEKE